MPQKKIMIIGMSPNVGGVETYIMNIFRNIDKTRFELFFPYYDKVAYKEEIEALGGHPLRLEVSRHTPLRYMRYMNDLFHKYQFDAVYYNTCDIMSMDMIVFGKKNGVPIRVIHSHNSSNIIPPNFFHKRTEAWCRKHLDNYATKLLACSEVAGKWMFDGREFEIIKNGIDTKKYQFNSELRRKIRSELHLQNSFVLGFVGSLWEQKNPLFLLDILSRIIVSTPETVLLVVGDGMLRAQMEKKASDLGVSKNVMFLGIRRDVSDLMNAMDRFLLPSNFEGLPFVLVEAQANGLPCITSTNVSEESNITGEVKYIGLDASLDIWAKEIINFELTMERIMYSNLVLSKGYDIKATTEHIESILAYCDYKETYAFIYKKNS